MPPVRVPVRWLRLRRCSRVECWIPRAGQGVRLETLPGDRDVAKPGTPVTAGSLHLTRRWWWSCDASVFGDTDGVSSARWKAPLSLKPRLAGGGAPGGLPGDPVLSWAVLPAPGVLSLSWQGPA